MPIPPDHIDAQLAWARESYVAGRLADCLHILESIPAEQRKDGITYATIELEKVFCLLRMATEKQGVERLELFHRAYACFQECIYAAPFAPEPYATFAEFWRLLGDEAMRTSLRRFADDISGNPSTSVYAPPAALKESCKTPSSTPAPMRLLFIMNTGQPDYGLDTLYDGLCQEIGPENVIDFPEKPTIHGETVGLQTNQYERYPCICDHPRHGMDLDAILAELSQGRFDAILFGDVKDSVDNAALRSIFRAKQDAPLFVVDQQDDPRDNRHAIRQRLSFPAIKGYFKREYLSAIDLGEDAFPLPFAYPNSRVSMQPTHGGEGLFWAGHRRFGQRRAILEYLERETGRKMDKAFAPQDYAVAVHNALAGLSLFGVGFDTIRYWEILAQGTLLIAQRPPIRIPHNFTDGRHALFFDTPADLAAIAQWCEAHPEQAEKTAALGYQHLLKHHTSSARARQLLTVVHQRIHH